MKNLMNWMKETTSPTMIYPTAMSSIRNSQTSAITQIIWLASYSKLNENGKLVELEENSDVEELGWQFVTSSEDGTVAFWDLRSATSFPHIPQLILLSKSRNNFFCFRRFSYLTLISSFLPHKFYIFFYFFSLLYLFFIFSSQLGSIKLYLKL